MADNLFPGKDGASGETRTLKVLPPVDFESTALPVLPHSRDADIRSSGGGLVFARPFYAFISMERYGGDFIEIAVLDPQRIKAGAGFGQVIAARAEKAVCIGNHVDLFIHGKFRCIATVMAVRESQVEPPLRV